MRRYVATGFVAGLAITIGLVAWQGVAHVAALLGGAGWQLGWLGAFYLIPVVLAACSWHWLFRPRDAPALWRLGLATWVGLSVNWLLPVAQVGGELAKARLIVLRGVPGPVAGASVVVDKTLQAGTQLLYGLVGLIALVAVAGGEGFVAPTLALSALFAIGVYGFYRVQRAGVFASLARVGGKLWRGSGAFTLSGSAEALDRAVGDTYGRRGRLAVAVALRLAFRVAMAGEIWLALFLLGHPVTLLEAVIVESLAHSIRSAAFAVPAGLGVQEGGFVLVGAALGIGPDVSLALSLARRGRELMVGIPGLVAWQLAEGRAALRAVPPRGCTVADEDPSRR